MKEVTLLCVAVIVISGSGGRRGTGHQCFLGDLFRSAADAQSALLWRSTHCVERSL